MHAPPPSVDSLQTDNENFAAAANKTVRVAASSITQTMKATAKLLEVEPPTIEVNGSSLKAEGGALLKLETEDIVIGGQVRIASEIVPRSATSSLLLLRGCIRLPILF
jgi:hypothetical protein